MKNITKILQATIEHAQLGIDQATLTQMFKDKCYAAICQIHKAMTEDNPSDYDRLRIVTCILESVGYDCDNRFR